ncbi:MAG TPA: EVE domain-containing protein [Thermoanaerobaculia bacterium]|nr:EVE domain-containing protein [Thermoanaerobaculia bacterium]
MAQQYWLLKSEPDTYSIDDLARDRRTGWEGVRNFQARNLLRSMKAGELGFFYHSSATPPGIAGILRVAREAYPDPSQFDPKSGYHDAKSDPKDPRWSTVEVEFVRKLPELLALVALREMPELREMALLRRGQRLSVQPVTAGEWKAICRRAGVAS